MKKFPIKSRLSIRAYDNTGLFHRLLRLIKYRYISKRPQLKAVYFRIDRVFSVKILSGNWNSLKL